MLKIGAVKMKVRDKQNRKALRNIDPKQPFHRMGLTAGHCLGQELELTRIVKLGCRANRIGSASVVPADPEFNFRFFASSTRYLHGVGSVV
jgi:hypothetical protein